MVLCGGAVLTLTACAVSQRYASLGAAWPTIVDAGCGATVEVFENSSKGVVMLKLNPDASQPACLPPRQALMRKAAESYFAQTRRSGCVLRDSPELSPLYSEFIYSC